MKDKKKKEKKKEDLFFRGLQRENRAGIHQPYRWIAVEVAHVLLHARLADHAVHHTARLHDVVLARRLHRAQTRATSRKIVIVHDLWKWRASVRHHSSVFGKPRGVRALLAVQSLLCARKPLAPLRPSERRQVRAQPLDHDPEVAILAETFARFVQHRHAPIQRIFVIPSTQRHPPRQRAEFTARAFSLINPIFSPCDKHFATNSIIRTCNAESTSRTTSTAHCTISVGILFTCWSHIICAVFRTSLLK